jgi:uncharacterized damage-inducible protein DinB
MVKPLFLIFLALNTFAFKCPAQANDSLPNELAIKWENAKSYTLKMAELMPAESFDFKAVVDVMSFQEQLLHIANNIKWLSSTYLLCQKSNSKDTTKMDKSAVLIYISKAYDDALLAHYLTEKQLNEIVPFFAGPKTRRQILMLMHNHQSHHLGQLIIYLRLKGIKPPDYIGW